MSSLQPANVIANLIGTNVSTLDELLTFREINQQYREFVDNLLPDVWCRVLTKEEIRQAFENDKVYIVEQAYLAYRWYHSSMRDGTVFKVVPEVANFDFVTAFVNNQFPDIDNFFINEGLIDAKEKRYGFNALYSSIVNNDIDRAINLVNKGAGLRKPEVMGQRISYLGMTAGQSHPKAIELMRLLIAKGVDPNEEGINGRTALDMATDENLAFLVKVPGIDLNHGRGRTPTLIYRASKNMSIMPLILAGADINILDNEGRNVLFYVDSKEIPFLVQKGANINHIDNSGLSLLKRAYDDGDDSLVRELVLNGANPFIHYQDGDKIFSDLFQRDFWDEVFAEMGETYEGNRFKRSSVPVRKSLYSRMATPTRPFTLAMFDTTNQSKHIENGERNHKVYKSVEDIIDDFDKRSVDTNVIITDKLTDIQLKQLLTHYVVSGRGTAGWRKEDRLMALRTFRNTRLQ